MKRSFWLLGVLSGVALGCDDGTGPDVGAPQNLFYVLEASGDPLLPLGVLLSWDPVEDPDLEVYNVYSSQDGVAFDLRGSTTSPTFHDNGRPDLAYFVTSVDRDGDESAPSAEVTIDERLRLESPDFLESITLDRAAHLYWADNPFQTAPDGFRRYRIYSAGYSLDDDECGLDWSLEGTTVSPEFIAADLVNGVPLCFAVSAESIEGWESLWSPARAETPRPDARNVLVFRLGADVNFSGFQFFVDANNDGFAGAGELGIVTAGDRGDLDFRVVDVAGDLVLEPVRAGTSVALYGNAPVDDLTSIDIAPVSGFDVTPIEALPGFGYVFQMDGGDGFARFGAVRVTHVGADYLIFDWSYQTDPGNPELKIHGGLPTSDAGGITVKGAR